MPSPKFNPATGKIELVDQDTHIGKPVVGGTNNSVLFIDSSGNLSENNPGFTYDASSGDEQLKLIANKGLTYDFTIEKSGSGATGLMMYLGDDSFENYLEVGQGTGVGNVPFFLEIGSTSGEDGPLLSLFNEVDNLRIFYEGHATPTPTNTWIFETDSDTIRLAPGNEIFQVQGKFQIGGSGFTQIGGTQGFVEWFHDGTDGYITSSLGKIFIPQLDLGGASLGSFGDSTTEIDVRRTVSDLDNSNVTDTGLIRIGGDFTNAADLTYKIEITTGGAIGTAIYRWSDDGGATYDEENITTSFSPHTMNNGLKVWFVKGTGTSFTTNDFATITAIGTGSQKKTMQIDTTNNRSNFGGDIRLTIGKKLFFDG